MGLASLFAGAPKNDEVVKSVLLLLPNEVERNAFLEYLSENRSLYSKLRRHTYLLSEPKESVRRWEVSTLFVNYGKDLGDKIDTNSPSSSFGGFNAAAASFLYALIFYPNNPLAWALNAELYMRWEDQIASRWAEKLLRCRPDGTTVQLLNELFPEGECSEIMKELEDLMRLVIKTCSEHPEWRDSYPMKRGSDFYRKLLG